MKFGHSEPKEILELPESMNLWIQESLIRLGHRVEDSAKLATSIKRLSDFFIAHPEAETPWQESWAQIAYLSYFLPLNFLRVQALLRDGVRNKFISNVKRVIDFGAGPGTATLALSTEFKLESPIELCLIEKSIWPSKNLYPFHPSLSSAQWSRLWPSSELLGIGDLAIFSYSLTELVELPRWALNAEFLFIIEPSTQHDGRKLMGLRSKLIEGGYRILAPCVHLGNCPLLTANEHDWCHDRIWVNLPSWFKKIEMFLPFKNQTLTMSYLFASKSGENKFTENGYARTVGDPLHENGKTRQLICRGPQREFLSWLHRNKNIQDIPRGKIVKMIPNLESKGPELRVPAGFFIEVE